MTITVVTAPEPVVTVDEVAKHLGDLPTEDRPYVETLIAAAQGWIDGPAGWLARSIGAQLLEYRDDDPCSPIVLLPFGPVLEVVEAWSGDDAVDVSAYVPGAPAISLGTQLTSGQPLRVRYWAGYGSRDPDDADKWISAAPAPIKVAIMILVAQWYEYREAVMPTGSPQQLPFSVDVLLQPYRNYR